MHEILLRTVLPTAVTKMRALCEASEQLDYVQNPSLRLILQQGRLFLKSFRVIFLLVHICSVLLDPALLNRIDSFGALSRPKLKEGTWW